MTSIAFAVILSVFFLLDLYYQDKKSNYFFIRNFMYLVVFSIPYFLDGMYDIDKDKFYLSFFTMLVFGFIIMFLYFNNISKRYELSIMSCIFDGHIEISKKIDTYKMSIKEKELSYRNTLLDVHKDVRQDLPNFISRIYREVESYNNFTKYATYILGEFVSIFFSHVDARFTLRAISDDNSKMIAKITTRDNKPSDIPLDKDNLISFSMEDKEVKIYSRSSKKHYCTNASIKNGIYDDYATYCLFIGSNNMPAISLNLDVKGESAINRMMVLVDTSIFEIVCQSLVSYINKSKGNKNVCNN